MNRTLFYKLFVFIVFNFVCVASFAQGIYTKVTKYDKFDDVEWSKTIKTLITKTDSTIVIETKGSKPETYKYTDNHLIATHVGSRDSLVNIVADIWGYYSEYIVYSEKDVEEMTPMINQIQSVSQDSVSLSNLFDLSLKLLKRMEKCPVITFRTISRSRYSFEYFTDIVWIKLEDGSRIIYTKD